MLSQPANTEQSCPSVMPDVTGEILRFLWKWKLATSAMLHQRFMPTLTGNGLHSKLRRLRIDGLIQPRTGHNPRDIFWVLGKKSFQRVRNSMPEMNEVGYQSESLDHDVLVTAIHLGDGVFGPIPGLQFITEQQLRRLNPEHLPAGIPNCCGRRPDGYWKIKTANGSKLVALEVELHQKATSEYGSMARFYSDMRQIDRVLWVTRSLSMGRAIYRALVAETDEASKHNFIPLESIYRKAWHSSILIGPDKEKSIYELLEQTATKRRTNLFTVCSLDARVSPYISPCKRLFAPDGFSY